MNGWQFARWVQGWQWHRLGEGGEPSRKSTRVFPTLLECLEDATRHGYSPGMPGGDCDFEPHIFTQQSAEAGCRPDIKSNRSDSQ